MTNSSQTGGGTPSKVVSSGTNKGGTMPIKKTHRRNAPAQRRRSQYRIINHQEAGLFDSMTGATLWALKNLDDWNWRIEPVSNPL